VAVGAEEAQVFRSVVLMPAVDVVDVEDQRLTSPLRTESALGAAMLPAHLQQRAPDLDDVHP